jgi:hypothetical protein
MKCEDCGRKRLSIIWADFGEAQRVRVYCSYCSTLYTIPLAPEFHAYNGIKEIKIDV